MVFHFDRRFIRTEESPPPESSLAGKPVTCPFTIAVDTREQAPYYFRDIKSGYNKCYRPVAIETVRTTLKQGDYSIVGHESLVSIERKSKTDLFGTLSGGRDRFQRELERLTKCVKWSAVLVECEWSAILDDPPDFTEVSSQSIIGSILAFQQRHPTIHWLFMPGRQQAEITCFKILERAWKEHQGKKMLP